VEGGLALTARRLVPLALADSSSVAPEDLIVTDLVFADRAGEIIQGLWNGARRRS
jgi:hypothetical protein